MNNLNELGLVEMRQEEMIDVDGGWIISTAVGGAIGMGILASAGAAIYASFEAGYNQACN